MHIAFIVYFVMNLILQKQCEVSVGTRVVGALKKILFFNSRICLTCKILKKDTILYKIFEISNLKIQKFCIKQCPFSKFCMLKNYFFAFNHKSPQMTSVFFTGMWQLRVFWLELFWFFLFVTVSNLLSISMRPIFQTQVILSDKIIESNHLFL